MVSSHQSHTWEQGSLYLSIQHHGLFSPIICMRSGTTLSVYTTPWSLLTNSIHETMDHSIYTTSWSLLTNHIHENRDHSICLCNTVVSSHQSHTWDQGPLYLSIKPHGLFSPTLFISGPWSHEYNWWEETMVLYRQIEWSLFSCMGLVRRDHGVV
jgi:hypothetical protein